MRSKQRNLSISVDPFHIVFTLHVIFKGPSKYVYIQFFQTKDYSFVDKKLDLLCMS